MSSSRSFPGQPLAVVTGATGFVAGELIKQLLERGYAVRGTVRDPSATDRLKALAGLSDSLAGSLEFVHADLVEEGSFDEAVQGATYVFHVASPCVLTSDDPEREIIRPAVQGTENVLRAVAKASPRPRRVVLTSSVVAILSFIDSLGDRVFSSDDWNEKSTIETEAYSLSKTLAERRAWELAKEHDIDMVAVNPSFVFGPVLSRVSTTGSLRAFIKALTTKKFFIDRTAIIDVRDAALTHIRAAETPGASGRYIASSEKSTSFATIFGWLREAYPDAGFPEDDGTAVEKRVFDASKLRDDLAIVPRPTKETILDTVRALLALGLVSFD